MYYDSPWFILAHGCCDAVGNRQALVLGYRLLSAYTLPDSGEKIWIITEADRSVTTLLLPSEY